MILSLTPSKEQLLARWKGVCRPQYILPLASGSLMLCASVLPWLNDPLGKAKLAWNLPVDIGWQFHIDVFNYGLLCLLGACCSFAAAYINWKIFRQRGYFSRWSGLAGCLCLLPVLLFLLQYLFADLVGINQLAQHRVQMLLIQRHFGYAVALPLIPLDSRAFSASTLQMRLELLVDQLSIGPFLPIISGWLLIETQRRSPAGLARKRRRSTHILGWLLALVFVVICGRAPAAIVCDYQAKVLLAQGNYAQALQWLDRAVALNPQLDRMTYYHVQRGEALYYLQPGQLSDEIRFYLASSYLQQKDNLNAYRELFVVWQTHRGVSWITDEMSTLLTNLAENVGPLSNTRGGGFNVRVITQQAERSNDEKALSWLQVLSYADPTDVYSRYMIGRIDYDLGNYAACGAQMAQVIALSRNADIQSSAYTYMALSDAGQGDYIDERALLLEAVALDPAYWNNTAREELSGLR
jgi:tetratricopeptide (TPR) repeat protein